MSRGIQYGLLGILSYVVFWVMTKSGGEAIVGMLFLLFMAGVVDIVLEKEASDE